MPKAQALHCSHIQSTPLPNRGKWTQDTNGTTCRAGSQWGQTPVTGLEGEQEVPKNGSCRIIDLPLWGPAGSTHIQKQELVLGEIKISNRAWKQKQSQSQNVATEPERNHYSSVSTLPSVVLTSHTPFMKILYIKTKLPEKCWKRQTLFHHLLEPQSVLRIFCICFACLSFRGSWHIHAHVS